MKILTYHGARFLQQTAAAFLWLLAGNMLAHQNPATGAALIIACVWSLVCTIQ